jgi:hypothetical protein
MIADPARNLAYVIDKTNQRLLAIDTQAGIFVGNIKLAADPGDGRLALSPDGLRLYVALTTASKIQVISLPDFQQADLYDVGFQLVGLAAAVDGKLYASSSADSDYLWQVDASSGQVLTSFGQNQYYSGAALRLNGAGNALFIAELGLSGAGELDEYTIATSGTPVYNGWHPYNCANTKDLTIDDTYRRIYTIAGGVYGIGVTEMDTWVGGLLWPFGAPYGAAMCFLPGDNFISGGSYYNGIFRFNRADGTRIANIPVCTGNQEILDRDMVMTANGRILYAVGTWRGDGGGIDGYNYWLGIVGASSFTLNIPTQTPSIYLGTDQTVHLSQTASIIPTIASSGTATTTWTVVSGPQGGMFAADSSTTSSASFSTPGTYLIRATVTDSTGKTASDQITVKVIPDTPTVSVTATKSTACAYGLTSGQLTFTRTGIPSGALVVNYTCSSDATAGTDFSPLPGTVTIPDGSSSATVNVTPLAGSQITSAKTVTASVNTSANYNLGVSQRDTVTLKDRSYATWKAMNLAGLSTADQADKASPAQDGIPNLLKFALKLDPALPSVSGLPKPVLASISGKTYQTLTYTRVHGATDISYIVEVSNDLVNWYSGPAFTVEATVNSNDDGTDTVTTQELTPASQGVCRFMRLKVTNP